MPGPIIFKARVNADVHLRAFDTDFHVHSVILKIHSAFFSKFLDSADKTATLTNPTPVGCFKYEWVTKVDEDGTWGLVAGNRDEGAHAQDFDRFKKDKDKQVKAFEKLLQTFYGEHYILESVAELKLMTQLADYYCALPALSNAISLPLFRGDIEVQYNCEKLIEIAAKLRHADLFRECVIWIAGDWAFDPYWVCDKLDSKIQKTIKTARNKIGASVAQVHKELLDMTRIAEGDIASRLARVEYDEETKLPQYFRQIGKQYWGHWNGNINAALSDVLGNCFVYSGSGVEAGSEWYEAYFLCATVDDEDLPWDRNQTDW